MNNSVNNSVNKQTIVKIKGREREREREGEVFVPLLLLPTFVQDNVVKSFHCLL